MICDCLQRHTADVWDDPVAILDIHSINMSRLPSCSIYGCRWHMSITVGRVMSMYHTWFSDEWRRKADELFEWESLYITSSSLRLWSWLRPSGHQGIPNWLQQWGGIWFLTEIDKWSECDLRRSFMSWRKSPRCNWDGGCMQATESRARPHWVFQGECRIALFKTFSSILVPTNFLLHLTLVAQQFGFLLFFSSLEPPLTLEELCMTIEAGSCLQHLGFEEY